METPNGHSQLVYPKAKWVCILFPGTESHPDLTWSLTQLVLAWAT